MATNQSPLEKAIDGEADKLTDKQAKSALSQAVDRITSLSREASASSEALTRTGTQVVHTVEIQGSLFLSSMAEGYLGEEKLKVGGVDLRAPIGLVAEGYGLYQTLSGEEGGEHALAIGHGILGSWLASMGVQAGRTLAEKRGEKSEARPQPTSAPAPSMQGPLVQVPALPPGHVAPLPAGYQTALPAGQTSMQGSPVRQPGMGYQNFGQGSPAQGSFAPASSSHGVPRVSLIPEPMANMSGPVREVLLTPPPAPRGEGVEGPLRRQRRQSFVRAAADNRFPRAQASEEELENFEQE